jgi:hypothetical protein
MSPYWHQGTGELANYRWRGSPSHHNYDDVIHGYGAYYDLAADDAQKEFIRRDVHNLMSYIVDNNHYPYPLIWLRGGAGVKACYLLWITELSTPIAYLTTTSFTDPFGIFSRPVRLDLHLQEHIFQNRKTTKSDLSNPGYPGYETGGSILSGGLSFRMEL